MGAVFCKNKDDPTDEKVALYTKNIQSVYWVVLKVCIQGTDQHSNI